MSNEKYCPVCGELNDCAMAMDDSGKKSAGQDNHACWCFQKAGALNQKKLAGLSRSDDKRCLCQKCWDKFSE